MKLNVVVLENKKKKWGENLSSHLNDDGDDDDDYSWNAWTPFSYSSVSYRNPRAYNFIASFVPLSLTLPMYDYSLKTHKEARFR